MITVLITVVEVKDPLKQGLKLQDKTNISYHFYIVEVKDPLKQGLKHIFLICFNGFL
mgnify:CR=1 FL=1